jgi:hypothetical protein
MNSSFFGDIRQCEFHRAAVLHNASGSGENLGVGSFAWTGRHV